MSTATVAHYFTFFIQEKWEGVAEPHSHGNWDYREAKSFYNQEIHHPTFFSVHDENYNSKQVRIDCSTDTDSEKHCSFSC